MMKNIYDKHNTVVLSVSYGTGTDLTEFSAYL